MSSVFGRGVAVAKLLEFRNVTKTYTRGMFSEAGTTALADFSMSLEEDKPTIMTVAGESGSGKTTLAMLLLGFIDPTKGEILYKGKNISKLRGAERLTFRREVQPSSKTHLPYLTRFIRLITC